MTNKFYLFSFIFMLGCASPEQQMAETLRKNPKLVFDVIEENPQLFIEVVNRAARKAQEEKQSERMSKIKLEQEEQLKNPLKPQVSEKSLLYGSNKAPIIIVEYADFQCPACKIAYEPLKQIAEKYKDGVQIHYKHMPLDFHKMALPAARYYEAIKLEDKTKAEKFYSLLFQDQNLMKNEEFLKRTAKNIGSDPRVLQKNLKLASIDQLIEQQMAEFQQFGFTGTPVILVNGVALHGAQPLEVIEDMIQRTKK